MCDDERLQNDLKEWDEAWQYSMCGFVHLQYVNSAIIRPLMLLCWVDANSITCQITENFARERVLKIIYGIGLYIKLPAQHMW